jgi:hypothetical protein
MTKKETLVEIISSLLVILFIYTGLNKLLDHETFHAQLRQSPFIQPLAGFISATLPAGELLIALALIFKRTRLIGLYLSFFLMVTFTGYVYAMLHYSYYLPCSCGGILSSLTWKDHLLFNSIFTALAAAGALLQSKIKSFDAIQKNTVPA